MLRLLLNKRLVSFVLCIFKFDKRSTVAVAASCGARQSVGFDLADVEIRESGAGSVFEASESRQDHVSLQTGISPRYDEDVTVVSFRLYSSEIGLKGDPHFL